MQHQIYWRENAQSITFIQFKYSQATNPRYIKAKKHIIRARQIYLYLLAGIFSEPIFSSDRSPIRFRNIQILSLKKRDRFSLLVGSTKIILNKGFLNFLRIKERI